MNPDDLTPEQREAMQHTIALKYLFAHGIPFPVQRYDMNGMLKGDKPRLVTYYEERAKEVA